MLPPSVGVAMLGRQPARPVFRIGTLAAIAVAFSLGIAASRVHDRYTRIADCQRWHENVTRWAQVTADVTGELTHGETVALTLAHGGMIAVRDQLCGRRSP
jgi:hypothetical protein